MGCYGHGGGPGSYCHCLGGWLWGGPDAATATGEAHDQHGGGPACRYSHGSGPGCGCDRGQPSGRCCCQPAAAAAGWCRPGPQAACGQENVDRGAEHHLEGPQGWLQGPRPLQRGGALVASAAGSIPPKQPHHAHTGPGPTAGRCPWYGWRGRRTEGWYGGARRRREGRRLTGAAAAGCRTRLVRTAAAGCSRKAGPIKGRRRRHTQTAEATRSGSVGAGFGLAWVQAGAATACACRCSGQPGACCRP